MARLYLAGSMFSTDAKSYNERITHMLEGRGHEVFLPQREAGDVRELLSKGMDWERASQWIFDKDIEGIKGCDIVLLIMDGRVPDEGACVEIGYAYALGKECVGLRTDSAAFQGEHDNCMIIGALKNRIASDVEQLESMMAAIMSAQ